MSYQDTKYEALVDETVLYGKKKPFLTVNKLLAMTFIALVMGFFGINNVHIFEKDGLVTDNEFKFTGVQNTDALCPIPKKVAVKESDEVQFIMKDEKYQKGVIDRFSKAIQIDTVVYDETKNYSKMANFHKYLEASYPLVHSTAQVTKVNDYGLVFYFPGSDSSLKPMMLAAHQDTVPIGDPTDWTEDPFSGRFDGEYFHGRGSFDCKNLLVALMEATEKIIRDDKANFERGLILAFGFDEEKSGYDGAKHIGEYLEETFGSNSIEVIIDEGPVMFMEALGDYYGMIINGEKGYADIKVKINTPGGHSSNPKDHTSIGMLSKFLSDYEEDMYTPVLAPENPMMGFFECLGEHGRLPKSFSDASKMVRYDEKARQYVLDHIGEEPAIKYTVKTSQAIDIINGGDKANSLPREVSAIVNHRIAYGNNITTVWNKFIKHGKVAAEKYNIGLEVNGKTYFEETDNGLMNITHFKEDLRLAEPTSFDDEFWFELTGLIKSFYEDEIFPEKFDGSSDKKFIITPGVMTGNTDTRHYWNLSDHIFRVQPGSLNMFAANIHGPNEVMDLSTHLQGISFYYNYISHFCLSDE